MKYIIDLTPEDYWELEWFLDEYPLYFSNDKFVNADFF